ncbi:MAG TPA: lysoplasmalogenase [Symbiobacteriaceae bacterium]|nr:lysoplasmalogenase [Symbiobacteriaceae bacterium]
MLKEFVIAGILVSGIALVIALAVKSRFWPELLKTTTMIGVIFLAATGPHSTTHTWVLAALMASAVGDVMLIIPGHFLQGLLGFLVSHLLYVVAFGGRWNLGPADLAIIAGLGTVAALVYRAVRPKVLEAGGPKLVLAVVAYMAAISLMVWRALVSGNPLMAAGGVLFFTSDGILAVSRFGHPFRWADYCIWAAYFGAQFCFALSVA